MVKMLLVSISAAILVWLRSHVAQLARDSVRHMQQRPGPPPVAGIQRHLESGAIVTGRLIAYLGSVY